MALYELFAHPVERGYRAGLCSKAALFLLLATALTYIPPLLVAFRSHGESAPRPGRCALRSATWLPRRLPDPGLCAPHSCYLRVLVETEQLRGAANRALPAPGAARGLTRIRAWSTFPAFNRLQEGHLRVPLVSVSASRLRPAAQTGLRRGWAEGAGGLEAPAPESGGARCAAEGVTNPRPELLFPFLGACWYIRLLQAVPHPG